jgi:HEPN domain-containing protein
MGSEGHLVMESLLKKATRDFELAKKYRDRKELVTASLLYHSAMENALKALVLEQTKRKPPERASVGYLAMKVRLPEEISTDIAFLEDESAVDVMEAEGIEVDRREKYNDVLSKGSIVRRLISYAEANR